MSSRFLKDSLGWGLALWLIGYVLGFILFFVVPPTAIGWVIMPIGICITAWVLLKKIKGDSFLYYVYLAAVWTVIAIALDYFFIVQLLKPVDGYYKLDVYLYYGFTFAMPLIAGWLKTKKSVPVKGAK